MRSRILAAAVALALAPAALAAAQDRPADSKEQQITLRGCVVPAENDTYVMTNVVESPGASGTTMPAVAHGRRVMFWLKNDDEVRDHKNQMVEVSGKVSDLEESEIELKAGEYKDGGLLVEFEGPGRDVVASNADVGAAVGTAGRQPEENDIKTYLAEVDVTSVKALGAACN
ncbi:MAG: hypothetical protein AB7K63_15115 [Vicinamibacterales bacterium]